MYYSEEQKELLDSYIHKAFNQLDVHMKCAANNIAVSEMVPYNNDMIVSDAIVDYVFKYFCDNGYTSLQGMIPVMPKTVMYVIRNEIIELLKRSRINIEFSCDDSIHLAYGTNNEPVTVTCHTDGGNDPYNREHRFELECNALEGCEITETGENSWNVTFSEVGVYTFKATSFEKTEGYCIGSATYIVEVLPSINNAPMDISLSYTHSVEMPYVNTPNEPISIDVTMSGGADPEGKPVTKNITCPNATVVKSTSNENLYTITFTTPGTYTMTAISTDPTGKSTTKTGTIVVNPSKNLAPSEVVVTFSCGKRIKQPSEGASVTVTCNITGGIDPEGKGQTMTASFPGAKSVQKIDDYCYNVTYNQDGLYTATATATDASGQQTIGTQTIAVEPPVNNPPTDLTVTLSCGSSITLGSNPYSVTVTVSGGIDPEGKAVTKTVECSTAKSVTKVNDTTWTVVIDKAGIHNIMATATDVTGLKTVKTATVQAVSSSGSSTGQFVGAKFDSGWSDLVNGCYINKFTISLSISSGHSSSSDYFVILGKKSDGSVVILRDVFKATNRFVSIAAGSELANSKYTKGNLSSTTWGYTDDPYTVADGIRQIRFVCETPGHESCAKSAKVNFTMGFAYDVSFDV